MIRTIITATEDRTRPGSFTVMSSARKDKRGIVHPFTAYGSEEAAAKALEYAIDCRGGYAIVAARKVLEHIPSDMRERA